MAATTPNNTPPTGSTGRKVPIKLVALLGLGTVMIVSMSSLMLIFFGMLPTIVAYVIDRSYSRSNTICVGAANLCGVFPYLLELWLKQHSMAGAMLILTDIFSIAIMYFAAAFGWMLYIAVPPVVVSVLRVLDQHRVVNLKARQKKLLDEWSRAVAEDVKDSAVLKEHAAKPISVQSAGAGEQQGTEESAAPPAGASAPMPPGASGNGAEVAAQTSV